MEDTKTKVANRYSDSQKALIRKFMNDEELSSLLFKDLAEGVSRVTERPFDSNGWTNELYINCFAIPKQEGKEPNRAEFVQKAEAQYEAQHMIKEVFASWNIVKNIDETPKEPKKKPSLK